MLSLTIALAVAITGSLATSEVQKLVRFCQQRRLIPMQILTFANLPKVLCLG